MAWLHVVRGPFIYSRSVALENEHTTIGHHFRSDVCLAIPNVSRWHAVISRRADGFVLRDLSTRSGTRLNLRRINGPCPLRDGDHVYIGNVELTFESRAVPATEAVNGQAMLSRLRCHGREDEQRLRQFAAACRQQFGLPERGASPWDVTSGDSAWVAAAETARHAIEVATSGLVGPGRPPTDAEAWAAYDAAEAVVCRLLRDAIGPAPFQAVVMNPSLLRWQDGTVVKLARAIHDQGRFGDMPVLADALQEAGCDSEAILAHYREQGSVHGPDCWDLNLILGKATGACSSS
jgi:hypothetical protein